MIRETQLSRLGIRKSTKKLVASSLISAWRVHLAALLLFSSSITVYCTCYSHSSVCGSFRHLRRNTVAPFYRSNRLSRVHSPLELSYTGHLLTARPYTAGPRQMRRSKMFIFSPTNLKQFNSGILHTWTYMKFLFCLP